MEIIVAIMKMIAKVTTVLIMITLTIVEMVIIIINGTLRFKEGRGVKCNQEQK